MDLVPGFNVSQMSNLKTRPSKKKLRGKQKNGRLHENVKKVPKICGANKCRSHVKNNNWEIPMVVLEQFSKIVMHMLAY